MYTHTHYSADGEFRRTSHVARAHVLYGAQQEHTAPASGASSYQVHGVASGTTGSAKWHHPVRRYECLLYNPPNMEALRA